MNPRKTNARRGYAARQAKRRAAQATRQPLKEGKIMNERNSNILLAIGLGLAVLVACGALFGLLMAYNDGWRPLPTSAPVAQVVAAAPTQAPQQVVVVVEYPTQPALPTEPVVNDPAPTDAPALEPTDAPTPVSCNTPSIKAGKDAAATEFGEFLDTNLGKRMTFTSRKVVVPAKAWNDPLTPEELKSVEQTWLVIQVCVPEGTTGVIFAGGVEQGVNRYETGALLSLKPGMYEFRMRNGELVIWYPGQETFSQKDLERIFDQIRTGNFDIHSPLAFFATTADLFAKVPQDLVKERNVQIAPSLDPMVQ